MAARGVVVHGLALRHGKRQSGTVNGPVANNPSLSRKARFGNRPVHNDALPSFNRLIGIEDQIALMRVIENAQNLANNAAILAENNPNRHIADDEFLME